MSLGVLVLTSVGILPGIVAAHGGGEYTPIIPQWYGFVVFLLGFGILGASIVLKRRGRLERTEHALAGIFLGATVAALGGILMVQLTPVAAYSASYMPFPQAWYPPITLTIGLSIVVTSMLLGQLRWSTRLRYAVLGIFLGLWVAYPTLIRGGATYQHPVGYVIVLAVPLLVGYIVWRDGRDVLRVVLQDTVARRFGIGIGTVMGLFFMFSIGLVSLVPEDGVVNGQAAMDTPAYIDTQPFVTPLVRWSAVEVWFPQIPLDMGLSVGTLLMVLLLSSLVTINAMLAAYQWCYASGSSSTQSTSDAAALVGPNACGCCGPMLAQVAVVLFGPSVAAPIYWVFVDFSSPVGSFFFVASVGLLTGGFVYSANALAPDVCSVPSQAQPERSEHPARSD